MPPSIFQSGSISALMKVFSRTPQEGDSFYMCFWVISDADFPVCPFGFIAALQKTALIALWVGLCKREIKSKQVIQIAIHLPKEAESFEL